MWTTCPRLLRSFAPCRIWTRDLLIALPNDHIKEETGYTDFPMGIHQLIYWGLVPLYPRVGGTRSKPSLIVEGRLNRKSHGYRRRSNAPATNRKWRRSPVIIYYYRRSAHLTAFYYSPDDHYCSGVKLTANVQTINQSHSDHDSAMLIVYAGQRRRGHSTLKPTGRLHDR